MANTKSAKKNALQNIARAQRNLARRTAIKTATKKVILAVEAGSSEQDIQVLLKDVAAKLYRARGKNIIHRNTAARKLSRLSLRVAKAANPATVKKTVVSKSAAAKSVAVKAKATKSATVKSAAVKSKAK